MNDDKKQKFIASCSGGKDSVATLILAKEHGEPLDAVVYAEVMFDTETSGEMPEHRKFVYENLKPFVEKEFGIPFHILHAQKTYVDVFTHIITKGNNAGKEYGFAYPGMCAVNRDCKIPPIREYWKSVGADVVQYVGIAADETVRLRRLLNTNRVSLLAKYGFSELNATHLCQQYGLYSPGYKRTKRNGCWFCPNCKYSEWAHLIFNHPELFDKLIELEVNYPNRARKCLTINETPTELKQKIMLGGEQLCLL
jgi:3'-phosphoadenosine 5'-phosphosulfate sulfotransferase (PAPS reductase)/FAD synthetase